MKKPTCDCLPLGSEKIGKMRPTLNVFINRIFVADNTPAWGKYLQLNYCPQCGKPYEEEE